MPLKPSKNDLNLDLYTWTCEVLQKDVSKSAARATGFTTEDEHLIKSVAKRLLKMVF